MHFGLLKFDELKNSENRKISKAPKLANSRFFNSLYFLQLVRVYYFLVGIWVNPFTGIFGT